MSQGDIPGSPDSKEIITNPHHHHQILITKASSSPPRSRSQSTGSAHQEALLFFEKHQLFKAEGSSPEVKVDEESLIRKRSIRGRSHSQPSQVLLSTGSCRQEGGGGALENLSGGGSEDLLCGESGSKSKYTSSWLEQIQFTAQYQHYRTNDYSSVVNSASSLDKVLDQGATPSGSGAKSNLQQQVNYFLFRTCMIIKQNKCLLHNKIIACAKNCMKNCAEIFSLARHLKFMCAFIY
jgi:hypothetical protein